MPSVSQIDSPPSSPRSPPRKRSKFSLKLKGKRKSTSSGDSEKRDKLFPIFSPPATQNTSDDDTFEPPVPPPPYAGLKNHGNICYANAVLQVLRHCPGLMESVTETESFIRQLCPTVGNTQAMETGTDNQASQETDQCSGSGEDHKSVVCRLKELFSQMKDLELDYSENKENCEHLVQRRNYLILAAKPLNFMEIFRKQNPMFEDNLQHDAQEFLCSLLVNLQDTENDIKKKMEQSEKSASVENFSAKTSSSLNKGKCCSPFEDLFHGRLLHQTKCMTCEDAKKRFEDFQDISVPIKKEPKVYDAKKAHTFSPTPKKGQDSQSLCWALSQFARVEHLSGDNKYFCENCLTHTEAEISTCFDKLPRILTIHLKRFTANALSGFLSGSVSKITSNLETPMELSLKEWCSKTCPLDKPTYHLFGIVMHSGMTSCSGHYQAYVKVTTTNMADVNNNGEVSASENVNKMHSDMEGEKLQSRAEKGKPGGDDKSSESMPSPQSSAEKPKTTCMSGITRYFHKSRKLSTKETKMEDIDEERKSEPPVAEEKQTPHNTPTFSSSGTGKSLSKIQSFQYRGVASRRTAIRQLNFQDSNGQLDQDKKCQDATNDEETSNLCRSASESKTFQWIHFDDAEVAVLEESDVLTVLSSSESSFTSPYLLFYKLAQP